MGIRASRSSSKDADPKGRLHRDSIVPSQDPLLQSFGRKGGRIVHDELGKDFKLTPQVLGTGYSGAVRLAEHKATGQQMAVKQFAKRRLKESRLRLLQSEVEVYLQLDHPNICRLLHCYEGRRDVWLVMELCACELYGRLAARRAYAERDAADLAMQMLQAVSYLHNHKIVHRDLKLENWMCSSEVDGIDRLKLIDFGFSRILARQGETLDMPCGTIHYTSPEVLARSYTSKCDMWSFGVITYMLLMGRPPFRDKDNPSIARAIMRGNFYQEGRWLGLSTHAKDFIRRLLCKDESKRLSAGEALGHRWVTGAAGAADASKPQGHADEVGVEVLQSLRQFAQGSHLRRAALTMLAYSLTSRELDHVEQAFLAFDVEGRGTVTLEQLAGVLRERCGDVSSREVQRIFESLDFTKREELHYTPFIAAVLATKVQQHEDRVRTAFEAFDGDGDGLITADSLVAVFSQMENKGGQPGLCRDEAEAWIKEVDYKGNGVVDYDGFLTALTGKHRWALPTPQELEELPTVRVFDEGQPWATRVRSQSEPAHGFLRQDPDSLRRRFASALLDDAEDEVGAARAATPAQTFTAGTAPVAEVVQQVSSVSCRIDESYFGSQDIGPHDRRDGTAPPTRRASAIDR